MKKLLTILCLFFMTSPTYSDTILCHQLVDNDGIVRELDTWGSRYTGTCKSYFQDGTTSGKGSYKDGLKDGLWEWYWENGHTSLIINYKKGKLHGDYFNYRIDGRLMYKREYKNGEPYGQHIRYYLDIYSSTTEYTPKPRTTVLFDENGEIVYRKWFDKNGVETESPHSEYD